MNPDLLIWVEKCSQAHQLFAISPKKNFAVPCHTDGTDFPTGPCDPHRSLHLGDRHCLSCSDLELLCWKSKQRPSGTEANMTVVGHLKSTVEKGSVIKVLFKLGPIKLLDTTLDLCESIEKIGKSCPLPAGETVLSHKFTVPNEIPPGKFSAQIELRNKDSSVISCLSANLRL
ncbi:hypothetical protein DFJ73DRAFT_79205 [Zopfochytrium polystomum]|nr:hypothetical protein DFJ73DRAFT_79205 [Zopfochytrium polystomum]